MTLRRNRILPVGSTSPTVASQIEVWDNYSATRDPFGRLIGTGFSGLLESCDASGTRRVFGSSYIGQWRAWTATGTMVAGDITFGSSQLGATASKIWEVIVLLIINQSSLADTTYSFGEGASGNPTAGTPDYSGGVVTPSPSGNPTAGAGSSHDIPVRGIWFVTATNNTAVRFRAQRGTATDVIRLQGFARPLP